MRTPRSCAATTSVVRWYSHRFENGDHDGRRRPSPSTARTRSPQWSKSALVSAVAWTPISPGCRQSPLSRSVNSSWTIDARQALGDVVDHRPGRARSFGATDSRSVDDVLLQRRGHDQVAAGRELLDVDDPHEPAVDRARGVRRALDHRRAADQRLDLDVLDSASAAACPSTLAGHEIEVPYSGASALVGPAVVVLVGDAGRLPQRQRVVGQVRVQVDQARVDQRAGVDPLGGREAGRRRAARRLHGGQAPVVADVDVALVEHGGGRVERDDRAGQDEGHPLRVRPRRAFQISVCSSSSDGRRTEFCARPPARTQASSPRKAGAPKGRSRRGIAAWSPRGSSIRSSGRSRRRRRRA